MRKRTSPTALILIDFIDARLSRKSAHLVASTLRAAQQVARLKVRAKQTGIPVIFANDHHGNWKKEFATLVDTCRRSGSDGERLMKLLQPDADDFVILKPRHSAFYGTPLEFLLEELRIKRLILAGIEADMCIMFTANDAYMRKFKLWVPGNCIGAKSTSRSQAALRFMKVNLQADVRPFGNSLRFGAPRDKRGIQSDLWS